MVKSVNREGIMQDFKLTKYVINAVNFRFTCSKDTERYENMRSTTQKLYPLIFITPR